MEFSIHDLCEVASLRLAQQSAYTDENKKIKIKKLSLLQDLRKTKKLTLEQKRITLSR